MVLKKGNKINVGKTHSDDAKIKMSEVNKGEWKPFEEAREYARTLQLVNFREWIEYCKFGKDGIPKPNDIPDAPGRVYKNNGWKGMLDWLGNEWRAFNEAREFIRSLNLKN